MFKISSVAALVAFFALSIYAQYGTETGRRVNAAIGQAIMQDGTIAGSIASN